MAQERPKSEEAGTTLIEQAREKAEKVEKQVDGLKITVIVENVEDDREDEPSPPPPDPQPVKAPIREDHPKIDLSAPAGLKLRSDSGGHPKLTFSITIAG
jgi:hypothetical protein